MIQPLKLAASLLFGLALLLPVRAMTFIPLELDEIVGQAQVAFEGTCTANRSERDPQTGTIVTYTTFRVHEVLKGSVGATHTVKQLGGRTEREHFRVDGVPTFAVGQDYVLFFYGVSSAGFSSPVGLSQGRFAVRSGAAGPEVSNGRDFREMLRDHPPETLPKGLAGRIQQAPGAVKSVGLEEFKQFVRQQVGGAP